MCDVEDQESFCKIKFEYILDTLTQPIFKIFKIYSVRVSCRVRELLWDLGAG